jgi:hypothetical protein
MQFESDLHTTPAKYSPESPGGVGSDAVCPHPHLPEKLVNIGYVKHLKQSTYQLCGYAYFRVAFLRTVVRVESRLAYNKRNSLMFDAQLVPVRLVEESIVRACFND